MRGNLLRWMSDALSAWWSLPYLLAASLQRQVRALKCGCWNRLGPGNWTDSKSAPLSHEAPGQCRIGAGALRYQGVGEKYPILESEGVLLGVL